MAFKRKRIYAPRVPTYKKRRIIRRRKYRKKGTSIISGQAGYAVTSYAKKKTRRRFVTKRALWNHTNFQAKYGTRYTYRTVISTPASYVNKQLLKIFVLKLSANDFWTTLGGGFNMDQAAALPDFAANSITIRGGIFWMTLFNTGDEDLEVQLDWCWTKNEPLLTSLADGSYDRSQSAMATGDFNEIGKVYWTKRMILEPYNTFRLEKKLPMIKIDTNKYDRFSNMPMICVWVNQVNGNTSKNLTCTVGHSLSWVGDTIGA